MATPPPALVKAIVKNVGAIAASLNRYPDRDAVELRTSLAAYLSKESRVKIKPNQVWAANGSNEVMLQILQVFGGPGRTALTLTPTRSKSAMERSRSIFAEIASKRDYLDESRGSISAKAVSMAVWAES